MANTLTISANINGTVNNGGVGPNNGNTQLTPVGNNVYDNSLTIPPNIWTLVATGSNFGTASVIYIANTSNTSSLSFAISASGVVSNVGTIPPIIGTSNSATLIQWNNTFAGLYALTTPSASAGWYTVVSQ
jgi:hypothetical protein